MGDALTSGCLDGASLAQVDKQNERLLEVLRRAGHDDIRVNADGPIEAQRMLTVIVTQIIEVRPELETLLVDEDGNRVDLASLHRATPPEEWTLDEVWARRERLGWTSADVDPSWVEEVTRSFSQAFPERASEMRRVADFVLRRSRVRTLTGTHTLSAPRRQRREYRPRRRRAASSPRRARAPGRSGDDPSDEPDPVAAVAEVAR